MKRLSFFLFLCMGLFFSPEASAQLTCIDSVRTPNTYQPCGVDYIPVCGCDNKTYRNSCSAYYWGGLNYWSSDNEVCTEFHFDFFPTAISYFPAYFTLFMKNPGTATMYIYDVYGRLQYQRIYTASYKNQKIPMGQGEEVPVQTYLHGVYIVVVIAAGEKQTLKFVKMTDAK